MDVRVGTVDDIGEIVRLKALLMAESYPFDVELDAHPDWPDRAAVSIADMMASPEHRFFVVDAPDGATDDDPDGVRDHLPGGGLAGCISVAITLHVPGPRWGARHAYLGDMCTDAPFRGRGHGRALMAAALGWAREQGAQTARVDATPGGIALYERWGFERREGAELFPTMRRML